MMVVCSFYLKGTCKFGNSCRNEHPQGSSGGRFGGNRFGGTQQTNDRYHFTKNSSGNLFSQPSGLFGSTKTSDDISLIQNVRKELQEWDVNKVWPFSSFTAQKETACLPGFKDISPEEMRLEAYKNKETGLQPYLDGLQQLSNDVMLRRNQLKTMNDQQLCQEINGTSINNINNLFGNSATLSKPLGLFSGSTNSSGLFGGGGSNIGGGESNIGGVSKGLFSSNTMFATQNIASNTNTFGTSMFSNTTNNAGFLAGSNQNSNSNIISASLTNTQPSTNNSSNFFANSPFGLNKPGQVASASINIGGVFSQPLKTSGLFGSNITTTQSSSASASSVSSNPFLSHLPQRPQLQIYEKLKNWKVVPLEKALKPLQVTSDDIAKFKSDQFVLGEIPLCAPPADLC